MHFKDIINNGENIPKPKGLNQHIVDCLFKSNETAEEYFITEILIFIYQHA